MNLSKPKGPKNEVFSVGAIFEHIKWMLFAIALIPMFMVGWWAHEDRLMTSEVYTVKSHTTAVDEHNKKVYNVTYINTKGQEVLTAVTADQYVTVLESGVYVSKGFNKSLNPIIVTIGLAEFALIILCIIAFGAMAL